MMEVAKKEEWIDWYCKRLANDRENDKWLQRKMRENTNFDGWEPEDVIEYKRLIKSYE